MKKAARVTGSLARRAPGYDAMTDAIRAGSPYLTPSTRPQATRA